MIEKAPCRTVDPRQREQRFSADDVRSYDTQKFARADDLGILPEPAEMALVAMRKSIGSSWRIDKTEGNGALRSQDVPHGCFSERL